MTDLFSESHAIPAEFEPATVAGTPTVREIMGYQTTEQADSGHGLAVNSYIVAQDRATGCLFAIRIDSTPRGHVC